MEFLVLGPVEVRRGRETLGLGGPRPRAVLADLVVHVGSVVSTARLIDDLWGVEPPSSAEAIIQNAISSLRKQFGRSTIETVPGGYVLAIDPGLIDAYRFERLLRDARPLPPQERAAALRDALALWRGPAYAELAFEGFLQGEIARLDELRLTSLEDRLEAEIELGLHDRAEAELEALATQEPGRERLRRLQMLALHRSGRTQDALDVYEQVRRAIDDSSGLEPSTETKALQLMILRGDPLVSPPVSSAPPGQMARRPVALLAARVVVETGTDLEAAAAAVATVREAFEDAVARHGGVVSPSYGSESVAVFGAEVAHDDDVLRAGRAAVETSEIVRNHDVSVRFGVAVGRLLVEQGVPLILGEVVDEVRQALDEAACGEVVVSSSAADAAGGAFVFDPSDGSRVLGGVLPGRRPTVGSSPLVGRSAELGHLEAALRSAVGEASPRHVVVVGEPGIGKTRLVQEFVAGADGVVLSGSCVEYGEGITFLPVQELALRAASLDPGAPSLGETPNADAVFASARDLVQHFSDKGSVVVVLDDLQWGMPTFLDLVEYLPLACRGPVLILSVARPELLERRPAWRANAIVLEPLSGAETRTLIEALAVGDPLEPNLADQLVATSDGFPLFAEHLVAFTRSGRGSAIAARVPPSLDAVLAGRLDGLAEGELAVMQHAAVIGPRFDRAVLGALEHPADESRLDGRLTALRRQGLLLSHGDGWHGFTHALVRDAAYDGIPKARRAALHERIARYLDLADEVDATLPVVHLETAARQLREVGARRLSLEAEAGHRLGAAGLMHVRGGDPPAAVNLLTRARALLPEDDLFRLDISVELAQSQRDVGEYRHAVALLEESLHVARRLRRRRVELRVQVESIAPAIFSGREDDVQADEILGRAVPVFRRARDDRSAGRALLVRAFLASLRCRFADAAQAAEEALDHVVRAGYLPTTPLLVMAAAELHGLSPVADARDRCEELNRRADGHPLMQANVNLILSLIEALGGEHAHARRLLADAGTVYEERGSRLILLTDHAVVKAEIEVLGGDLEAALMILEAAANELAELGDTGHAARHDAARAEIALVLADPTSALELVRRAAAGTPASDVHATVTCMRVRGKVLAAQGQGEAGRRLVRKALRALEGTDALELRSRVLLDLAEVEARVGDADSCRAALDRAAAAAGEKGSVVLERRVEAMRATFDQEEAPGFRPPGPR